MKFFDDYHDQDLRQSFRKNRNNQEILFLFE